MVEVARSQTVTTLLRDPKLRKMVFKPWVQGAVQLLGFAPGKSSSLGMEALSTFQPVFTMVRKREGKKENMINKRCD